MEKSPSHTAETKRNRTTTKKDTNLGIGILSSLLEADSKRGQNGASAHGNSWNTNLNETISKLDRKRHVSYLQLLGNRIGPDISELF